MDGEGGSVINDEKLRSLVSGSGNFDEEGDGSSLLGLGCDSRDWRWRKR